MKRAAIALVALACLAAAGGAGYGKGGKAPKAALLAAPSGTLAVSGDEVYGGTVTLDASWSDVPYPIISVQVFCQTADTSVVYAEAAHPTTSPASASFVLGQPDPLRGTSQWDGSVPADCTASLINIIDQDTPPVHDDITLASVVFHVNGA